MTASRFSGIHKGSIPLVCYGDNLLSRSYIHSRTRAQHVRPNGRMQRKFIVLPWREQVRKLTQDQFGAYGSSASSVEPNSNYGPALDDFDWPMLAGQFYQQQQQPDNQQHQQHQQHQQVARQTISQPPCPSRSSIFDVATDAIPMQANNASETQAIGRCVTQASYDIPSTMVVDDDGYYTTDLSGLYSLGRPGFQGSPSKRTRGFVKQSVELAPNAYFADSGNSPTPRRDYNWYQCHDRGQSTSMRNRLRHMSQRRSASPDHVRGDTSCSVGGDEWASDEEAVLREVRRLDHFQRHVRYSAAVSHKSNRAGRGMFTDRGRCKIGASLSEAPKKSSRTLERSDTLMTGTNTIYTPECHWRTRRRPRRSQSAATVWWDRQPKSRSPGTLKNDALLSTLVLSRPSASFYLDRYAHL
jgi:hypothetical protein